MIFSTIILLSGLFIAVNGQDLIYFVFTPQCYQTFFTENIYFSSDCLKATLLKMVSVTIILGGVFVKMPQVIRILKNKSVYGISFASVMFQYSNGIFNVAYNRHRQNPFRIYGQHFFMAIQMLMILLLFSWLEQKQKISKYRLIILGSLIFTFLIEQQGFLPSFLLQNCIFVQMALISSSRILQIIHIFQCGSTGNLAAITIFLNFIGVTARLMTVLADLSNDWKLILSIFSTTILNGIILGQFIYFWFKQKRTTQKGD